MEIALTVLLALPCIINAWPYDSMERGYQMLIDHDDPWLMSSYDKWGFDSDAGGNSYQYHYPFFQNTDYDNDNFESFYWPKRRPNVKPPAIKPSQPMPPQMSTREWPSWIPPIRLIKLPLDEPPAPLD